MPIHLPDVEPPEPPRPTPGAPQAEADLIVSTVLETLRLRAEREQRRAVD